MALCSCAECDQERYHELAQEAARFTGWEEISAQAEVQGVAPLLYVHLKAAKVQLPVATKRELQGLYLQHRRANQIRMRVLRDILAAYDAVKIQALVLKGAALSQLVYPEPGLRPMSDLDILVPEYRLRRAQRVLTELGFNAPAPCSPTLPHRHLSAATLRTDGLVVQVELHHRLYSDYFDSVLSHVHSLMPTAFSRSITRAPTPSRKPDGLTGPPRAFALEDLTAHTLSHEDMLGHLCQHLVSHVNVWDSSRLIWIADIVSFAERFASEIDWEHVRRRHPVVLNTLSLLHFVTPLSDGLLGTARIKIGRAPERMGEEFKGWPRNRGAALRERGTKRILRDTFLPSEWWLRLRYRLGSARSLFWHRWVRHPLHIVGQAVRAALERKGWPTAQQLATGRTRK